MRHTEERGGLVVHRAAFQQQDGAELTLEAAPLVARADVAADVRLRLLLRARGEGWEGARRRLAPLAVEDRAGLGLARLLIRSKRSDIRHLWAASSKPPDAV